MLDFPSRCHGVSQTPHCRCLMMPRHGTGFLLLMFTFRPNAGNYEATATIRPCSLILVLDKHHSGVYTFQCLLETFDGVVLSAFGLRGAFSFHRSQLATEKHIV